MPSHQERIRAKNPEMNCNHFWVYINSSNIAPIINADGTRTTQKTCWGCGMYDEVTRSQADFEKELDDHFNKMKEMFNGFNTNSSGR